MTRFVVDPASSSGIYALLGSLVVPRPIGWISTRSADGVDNIAPHSFFQLVSTMPPIVMFSSMGEKDTVRNVRHTGEFVVCGATVGMIEQINLTAVDFDPAVSEFDIAGLTREASDAVSACRVAEAPFALECRCTDILERGNGIVVFGEVVLIALDEAIMEDGSVLMGRLDPVARLGGSDWSALGDIHVVPRLSVDEYDSRYGRTSYSPR